MEFWRQALSYKICLSEFDISWIDVSDMNPHQFELNQDSFHGWPILFERLGFHLPPIRPDFGGVVRRAVEIGSAEIEAKRGADDGHFDGEKFIDVID